MTVSKLTNNVKPLDEVDKINEIIDELDNANVAIDSKSITKNTSDELQTVGVIDSNNTTNAIKTWTGTKAQYDAIVTKDANTRYDITDDITNNNSIVVDLNGKADVDLGNTTDQAKILMSSMGMPSGTRTQLTAGASGTTYTAPANGWFAYNSWVTGSWISLSGNGIRVISLNVNTLDMSGYIPVKKSDSVTLDYDGTWSPHTWQGDRFVFIYAQGSESEVS